MIQVIHLGLGHIGREVAALVARDPKMKIVGAVDIAPDYAGKDLGDILGIEELGVTVATECEKVFSHVENPKSTVVMLTTQSKLKEIIPTINAALRHGLSVVSPAEELFYPQHYDEHYAAALDGFAKQHGAAVLGRGVNPGCLMDAYPLKVIQAFEGTPTKIEIFRHDDTYTRRHPLLVKTGTGLTPEQYSILNQQGKLGHVGLTESAAYVADGLGLKDYTLQFERKPAIADAAITPVHGAEIAAGNAAGVHEICKVIVDGQERIVLDLQMYVGATNCNKVLIHSEDGVWKSDYSDIVNGDVATARILHDAIYAAHDSQPGLNAIDYVPDVERLLKN